VTNAPPDDLPAGDDDVNDDGIDDDNGNEAHADARDARDGGGNAGGPRRSSARSPEAGSGGAPDAAPRRRPLVDLAPPHRARGDDSLVQVLWAALDDAAAAIVDVAAPHGFHSWPAGMPPALAARIVAELDVRDVPKSGIVVDPFSGGGTVGLEAVLHRRPFLGVDLNPLAARVGSVRTHRRSPGDADAFLAVIDAVVDRSRDRVRRRVAVRAEVPDVVAAAYAPHVLLELAGLLEEIDAVPTDEHRRTLAVVFSAILTKVSQRRGDTDGRSQVDDGGKRIGRFLTSEIFGRKAHELVARQVALFERVGPAAPRPRFVVDDARALPRALRTTFGRRAALVLTSPPYGGTYDYAAQHAHRLAWLGLDDGAFQRGEIGARRRRDRDSGAFDAEIIDVLRGIADALEDDGLAVLLMGDGEFAGARVPADEQLARLAPAADLRVIATVSAPRPDRRGGAPREEHLIALTRRA
jgi:hypothetical protein